VGLDPVLRRDLWARFHALAAAGTSLFVSSHAMEEADRCDRLLLMREGRLIADDTPRTLREVTGTDDLESAFLRLIRQADPPGVASRSTARPAPLGRSRTR
jgi:ABC-2 type transport system ATP-binding protein